MATITILPDGDVSTGFDTTEPDPPTTHYTSIDEGTDAPSDADYNETSTLDDIDEITWAASPANLDTCTQIVIKFRCGITDSTDAAYFRLELFHSAGTPVTGNPKDIDTTQIGYNDGTLVTCTETWSGLSLTKAQVDSLQMKYHFKSA